MSKGGLRPGAGRPPAAERKLSVIVRLDRRIADQLRATIPEKSRSEWIEELITEGLKKYQRSL